MRNTSRPIRSFALSATSVVFSALATLCVISILAACFGRAVSSAPGTGAVPFKSNARKTMRAFGSEEELKNYFRQLAEQRKRAARCAAKHSGIRHQLAQQATGLASG